MNPISQSTPEPQELELAKGYKPGDTPQGLPWPTKIFVVLPAAPSKGQADAYARIEQLAASHSVHLSPIKVVERRAQQGHLFKLLRSQDVAAIYRGAHRYRVGILALTGAKVLLDPSELPSNPGTVSLEAYVEHKCIYRFISRRDDVPAAWSEMMEWRKGEFCEGHKDPRSLPRMLFPASVSVDLNAVSGREAFIAAHKESKGSGALRDANQNLWQTGPHHTLDLIQVAGCCLPLGFHWDVQFHRNSVLANGWESWEVPGYSYTNIHPDALIRGGKATRTSSLKASAEGDGRLRTPRSQRKGRGKKK